MTSFHLLRLSTRGGWVVQKVQNLVYVVIECPLRVALIAPRGLCPCLHFPKPSQRGPSFTSDNAPSNWWPYTEYGAFFRYFWINYFHEVKILLRQLYDESILVFKCLDLSTPSTYLTFIVDTLVQSSVGTKSRLLVLFGYNQQPWMQMQRSSFTHIRVMRVYCQLQGGP